MTHGLANTTSLADRTSGETATVEREMTGDAALHTRDETQTAILAALRLILDELTEIRELLERT